MKSLYHAYLAYERRAIRGELDTATPRKAVRQVTFHPLQERLGDLLIMAGLRLKRRTAAGKPMAWSPLSGSKS